MCRWRRGWCCLRRCGSGQDRKRENRKGKTGTVLFEQMRLLCTSDVVTEASQKTRRDAGVTEWQGCHRDNGWSVWVLHFGRIESESKTRAPRKQAGRKQRAGASGT